MQNSLLAIFFVTAFFSWLLLTEPGLETSWAVTGKLLHSLADIELSAEDIDGHLLGDIQARNIRYRDAYVDVYAEQIEVTWNPGKLLSAEVHIVSVNAPRLAITLLDQVTNDNDSEDDSASSLPLEIHIDQIDTTTVELNGLTDTPLVARNISASISVLADRVVLKTGKAGFQGADFTTSGMIGWHPPFPLALDARIRRLLPGQAAITAQLHAGGELDNFRAQLISEAPYRSHFELQAMATDDGYDLSMQGPVHAAPWLVSLGIWPESSLDLPPVELAAQGHIGQEMTRIDLQLVQDRHAFSLNGTLLPEADFTWSLQAGDLKKLWPGAEGSAIGNGMVRGNWLTPSFLARLDVSALKINEIEVDNLRLDAEAAITHTLEGKVQISGKNLSSPAFGPADFSFTSVGKPTAQQADFNFQSSDFHAQGRLNGKLDLPKGEWNRADLAASGKMNITRLENNETLLLDIDELAFTAEETAWQARTRLGVNRSGKLLIQAGKPWSTDNNQPSRLRARLDIDLPSLQTLAVIAPEIEQISGSVKGLVSLNENSGSPAISGELLLSDGQLDLRDQGISIKPLTARFTGMPNGNLQVNASARSGDGEIKAQGEISANDAGLGIRLNIRGENFLATRTDEAEVHISPDLNFALMDQALDVNGSISIPRAMIRPKISDQEIRKVSEDQVLIGNEESREKRLRRKIDVRLGLGEDVNLEGMGLKTRLTGKLRIQETHDTPPLGDGEIRLVDGSYEFYGQKLTIERGRLIFSNAPLTQPAIDVRAIRKPRPDIKVGVRIKGLLDAPELTLFSSPSMRQSEQLSYLVLGRPLEGNEGNPSLAGAALAMGLTQGDRFIKGVGSSFSVDHVGIESEPGQSAEQASLVVGKYLSPRLYVSYGAGLFETLHRLRMRYRLTENWTLTGESGTAQGADILYTIER